MPGRLRALDGLRGLLALYILAAHTAPFIRLPPSAAWAGSILSHGRGAVELFFVLSGMVIMRSVLPGVGVSAGAAPVRVSARGFLLARAGRLLPVYAVALAAAAVALSCGNPFHALPWLAGSTAARNIAEGAWPRPWLAHMAAHITLTQGLLPPALLPDVEFTVLGPAWSLSTEWQFYLLIAVILAFRGRAKARSDDWRLFAGAMVAVGLAGLLVDLLPAPWLPGRAFLPHDAWYFALGIASHGLLSAGRTRATWAWWLLCLEAAALLQWQQSPVMASGVPLLWIAFLSCEAPKVAPAARPLAAVLNTAPLQWLGRISYPLYLIHLPLQRLMLLGLAPRVGSDGVVFSLLWGPAAILVPLIAAVGLHHWLEVPCWRWSRRLAQRARPQRPQGAGGPLLLIVGRPEGIPHQPIDGG